MVIVIKALTLLRSVCESVKDQVLLIRRLWWLDKAMENAVETERKGEMGRIKATCGKRKILFVFYLRVQTASSRTYNTLNSRLALCQKPLIENKTSRYKQGRHIYHANDLL